MKGSLKLNKEYNGVMVLSISGDFTNKTTPKYQKICNEVIKDHQVKIIILTIGVNTMQHPLKKRFIPTLLTLAISTAIATPTWAAKAPSAEEMWQLIMEQPLCLQGQENLKTRQRSKWESRGSSAASWPVCATARSSVWRG